MTIGEMKLSRTKKRRKRFNSVGMELSGALSVAAQMALLYPPGFDEWVNRELAGEWQDTRPRRRRSAHRR